MTGRVPKFRRRAEARPDEVLDAALALFIEKGFAASRVDDIAKRAGLSKGAVYLYFPSKEAIIEALVRRALVPVASTAAERLANFTGHPRDAITMLLRLFSGALSNPKTLAIPKLVMREVANFPELAALYRREVLGRAIPLLEGLIQRGINEGHLRQVDVELTVRSVVGPVAVHLMLAELFSVMPAGGLGMERLIENHLTILFEGLSAPARDVGAR